MIGKKFAPDISRSDNGLIKFPRDGKIRRQFGWSKEVTKHPAKFNCYMVWKLMEYLTEPGQRILDPMSGTGTTMLVAIGERDVVLIEVEEKYHNMQQQVLEKLLGTDPEAFERVFLINTDCRRVLPMPGIDAIIFSPPYGDMIKRKRVTGIAAEEKYDLDELPDYSRNPFNIGKLNQFMYFQVMEKVYKSLLETAPVMAVVLKDRIVDQKRIHFVEDNIKLCTKVGWKLIEEILIEASGTVFRRIREARGEEVVGDESIIIMRRK